MGVGCCSNLEKSVTTKATCPLESPHMHTYARPRTHTRRQERNELQLTAGGVVECSGRSVLMMGEEEEEEAEEEEGIGFAKAGAI